MTTDQAASAIEPRPSAEPTTPTPADPPESRCWFLRSRETVTIPLGSQAVTIAAELSALDRMDTLAPMLGDQRSSDTLVNRAEYDLRRTAAYLRAWTLPVDLTPVSAKPGDPLPSALEFRISVLRKLRQSAFEELVAVVDAHERAQADGEIIPPQVSLAADAWFTVEDETHTLRLPGDHWMQVRAELTHGEELRLLAAPPPEHAHLPKWWPGIRRLAAYIRAWSMVYPDGRPVVPGIDSLQELDATKFALLTKTLKAYEEALQKARSEDPTGAGGSTRPSALRSA
jgi:hypothetical protein